jgi:TPR repeat protein
VTVTTHTPSVPEDAAKHETDCAAGDKIACHAAALDHFYSAPDPSNDRAAVDRFRKACDLGYAPSCNGLGVMYAEGRGVVKDEARAAELYRASCDVDASTGCEHLADALRAGRGVAKNEPLSDLARERGRCLFEQSLEKDAGSCAPLPK